MLNNVRTKGILYLPERLQHHVQFATANPVFSYSSIDDVTAPQIVCEENKPEQFNSVSETNFLKHPQALRIYRKYIDRHVLESLTNARTQTKEPSAFLRIVKEKTAREIVELILPHRKCDVPLIEINPGPGVLTKQLLKHDVTNVKIIESDENYRDILQVRFAF